MKKLFMIIISIILIYLCFSPVSVYAAKNTSDDVVFTSEEIQLLSDAEKNQTVTVQPFASDLIVGKKLVIAKNGDKLLISGNTQCTSSVVKCGFTVVTVERRKNSNSSWTTYKKYSELYSDGNFYSLSKSLLVPSGYQYRVSGTHYAKKSIFSTQKISSTTGYIAF